MKKKIKRMYNRKILVVSLCLITLIAVLIFVSKFEGDSLICKKDSNCVMQQVTCCSCNMGGKEKCMSKSEAKTWQEKLNNECEEGILCIALYNCKDVVCECLNKNCTEIPSMFAEAN